MKDPSGFVYLLKADTGVYKIGRSKDPTARLNGMGTLPFTVELVHQVATNDATWLERGMHRRFAKRHVRGEWYALTAADVARIVAVDRCDRPQLLRCPKQRKIKKSAQPGKQNRAVVVWSSLARKVKIVAAIRGLDIFDYIDSILRPAVERDHEQALKQESGDR